MSRLHALRRKIRPWHLFALLAAAATIAAVLAGVLVSNRDHQRSIEEDRRTSSDQSKARANLGYAQYQGSLVGTGGGVAQYLGLRFAAPPLGERRFRAPLEPEDDFGYQPANTFGPICYGTGFPCPTTGQSEDCLYANVWAPANATRTSKLPVWLFIQGGGYTTNSNANWNGTGVVERSGRNIVLVNFNYRVGLWGFLASERVRSDGALNVGLLDQRAMMAWVKRHIAQFGGDPSHVVIHGGSAGAGSVALHLVAYGGTDNEQLFVGAVGESVFFPAQPFVADLEWQFDRLLAQTSCEGAEQPMACLRSTDAATLQAANVPFPFPGRPAAGTFYWTPCVDGDFLRDLPFLLFEKGQFLDVPLIVGTTSDEGTVFTPNTKNPAEMAGFIQNNYPRLNDSQAEGIVDQYPLVEGNALFPVHWPWYTSAAKAYGEATFICPGVHMLSSYVKHLNTSRAWGYRYNVFDKINYASGQGVVHLWESWAIFGPDNIFGPGRAPISYYTYNAPIVPVMMDYWISFVRTLDPSAMKNVDAPVWEPWNVTKKRLLIEVGNLTTEMVPQDQQSRCTFWKTLAPVTQQ
ncbi:carboxylesterase [Whalleya microplaca]|nr:carboxylesterase [Whalleya microplaca]